MFLLGSGVYLTVAAVIAGSLVLHLGCDFLHEFFEKELKKLDKKEKEAKK